MASTRPHVIGPNHRSARPGASSSPSGTTGAGPAEASSVLVESVKAPPAVRTMLPPTPPSHARGPAPRPRRPRSGHVGDSPIPTDVSNDPAALLEPVQVPDHPGGVLAALLLIALIAVVD